jgi:hypothetical protein
MISEKTYLSTRMLLSEILIFYGCSSIAFFKDFILEKIAYVWKVKPHLVGS